MKLGFLNFEKNKEIFIVSHYFLADRSSMPLIMESVRRSLNEKGIDPHLVTEYSLLIEEVVLKLIAKAKFGAQIKLEYTVFGDRASIKLTCPGEIVYLQQENAEDLGGKIIDEYRDYLKQSYFSGKNHIIFTSFTQTKDIFIKNIWALLLSCLTAIAIYTLCSEEQTSYLMENLIVPMDTFFVGCLKAIASPLVFFAIASLIIRLWTKFEDDSRLIMLFIKYTFTSLVGILLGFLVVYLWQMQVSFYDYSEYLGQENLILGMNMKTFIEQFTFSDFLAPLRIDNPIPLLILSGIVGLSAATLQGRGGNIIREDISALGNLFSKMLSLVYDFLPVFLYFSFLLCWLEGGLSEIVELLVVYLAFLPAVLLMAVIYALQLLHAGVNPIEFVKEYKGILFENLKIGSNITALPYNKRELRKKLKASPQFVQEGLILGTMANMDGSCIAIAACTAFWLFSANIEVSPELILSLIFIILVASLGAPNQPGTFLLVMSFVYNYLGISKELYIQLIIIEALLGCLYSTINSIGDIVSIVSEIRIQEKRGTTDSSV